MPGENLHNWTPEQIGAGLLAAIQELAPQMGFDRVPPTLILAQSYHETNGFRSDLLLRADNAFGMRLAHVRPTTAIGEDNGYAVYDTLADSVTDYLLRQQDFDIPNTADAQEYISATVASGYAEDANYADKWANTYADAMGAIDPGAQQAGTDGSAFLFALLGAAILTEAEKRKMI